MLVNLSGRGDKDVHLVADQARLDLMRRQAQRVGRPRAALDVAARVLSGLPGGPPMATPAPGTS